MPNVTSPIEELRAQSDEAHGTSASLGSVLVLFVILLTVAGLRFADPLLSPVPLGDEEPYVLAMQRISSGQDPYDGTFYFYPPALAVLGAELLSATNETATNEAVVLGILRLFNLCGLAALVTVSLLLWHTTTIRRTVAGSLLILLSPAVDFGMDWGNLSFWVLGLTVPALLIQQSRPWLAGALLSVGVAIKPLAAMAPVVFLVARWTTQKPWQNPRALGRETGLAAMMLGIQVAALAVGARYLESFLACSPGWPEHTRSVSVHRLLYLADIHLDSLHIFVAVLVLTLIATLWLIRPSAEHSLVNGMSIHYDRRLALAVVMSLAATPIVWSHTLLLGLPIQIYALRLLGGRRPTLNAGAEKRRHIYEICFVCALILSTHFAEGTGGIDDRAPWIQWCVQILPAAANLVLALYVDRHLKLKKLISKTET